MAYKDISKKQKREREYYQKNKEKHNARTRAYNQSHKAEQAAVKKAKATLKWDKFFGWKEGTHAELMRAALITGCALCGKPFENTLSKKPATDHDHLTGKFRGIIHHGENAALGFLGDSEAGCLQAAAYIKRTA